MDINRENKIITTIGRMNPPTSGHALLIKFMINRAILENLTQINIILSHTVDNEKNPVECEEKRMVLHNSIIDHVKEELMNDYIGDEEKQSKIKDMKVEIICMDEPALNTGNPILSCVFYILSLYGYDRNDEAKRRDDLTMELVIGQDRGGSYNWIGKTLSDLNPSVRFQEVVLPRSEGAMSATKVRNMALTGNEEGFIGHYKSMGLNRDDTMSLYEQIRENIIDQPNKKQKTEKGGKRRKNKKSKRKTRKNKRSSKRRRN
jgi:hypothetical protein